MAIRVTASDWEQQVADVLQLVVERCPAASRPRFVCKLLELNKTCRAAVQKARGQCHVAIHAGALTRCCQSATWLLKYAGLVCSIELQDVAFSYSSYSHKGCYSDSYREHQPFPEVIAHTLAAAIQMCAAQAAAPAAAAAVLGSAPSALPLRLQSFTAGRCDGYRCHGSFLTTPLMTALAATGVSSMDLHVNLGAGADIPTLSQIIGRSTGLQELSIAGRAIGSAVQLCERDLVALQQLAALTSMDVCLSTDLASLLPVSLKRLDAHIQRSHHNESGPDSVDEPQMVLMDLSHLTALSYLTCHDTSHRMCRGSVIKAKLPARLDFLALVGRFQVRGLQCLGRLQLNSVYMLADLSVVRDLACLAQPWSLWLQVNKARYRSSEADNPVEAFDADSALMSCTQLTCLDIFTFRRHTETEDTVAEYAHLATMFSHCTAAAPANPQVPQSAAPATGPHETVSPDIAEASGVGRSRAFRCNGSQRAVQPDWAGAAQHAL